MGVLHELMDKWKEMRARQTEEREELPDDATRDKYLRSLRRQWRVINEQKEKEILKKEIAAHFLQETRKNMFGMREDFVRFKKLQDLKKKKKAINIMKERKYLLGKQHSAPNDGYFGRHNL